MGVEDRIGRITLPAAGELEIGFNELSPIASKRKGESKHGDTN